VGRVGSHRVASWFRFGPLLFFLTIAMFASGPLVEAGYGGVAASLAFPALFLAAAVAIFHAGWIGWIAVGMWLGIVAIALRVQLLGSPPLYWERFVDAAFVAFVAFLLLREVVRSPRVTLDTILGAISVYFLIAVFYASLYSALEMLHRGSFVDGGQLVRGMGDQATQVGRYPALGYYSLVTMTTLGYGDIVPVTSWARNLAASQALLGQLYVAILIAFLVGLLISHRQQSPERCAGGSVSPE